jgi:hypothetical protein
MYLHVKKLMYTVTIGEPDVRFGKMLLEHPKDRQTHGPKCILAKPATEPRTAASWLAKPCPEVRAGSQFVTVYR